MGILLNRNVYLESLLVTADKSDFNPIQNTTSLNNNLGSGEKKKRRTPRSRDSPLQQDNGREGCDGIDSMPLSVRHLSHYMYRNISFGQSILSRTKIFQIGT